MKPSPRFRLALTASFFAQGAGFAVVLTHLPNFSARFTLDELAITVIMLGVAILAGLGSGIANAIAARVGSAWSLRVGLSLVGLSLISIAFVPTLLAFLFAIGVYGLGLGMVDASENMQGVSLESRYGRAILNSMYAAWTAGGIVGALVVSATSSGVPEASLAGAGVLLVACAFLPFAAGSVAAPAAEKPHRTSLRPILLLGIALLLFYVVDSAASSWSAIYLKQTLGSSAAVAPIGYAAYQTTSLLSRAVGDSVVRRFGPVAVVRAAAVCGAAGLILVITAVLPVPAIVGFAVMGAGMTLVAPLTFSAVGSLVAGADSSAILARSDALVAQLNVFNYVGFVLGGVVTGVFGSLGTLRLGFVAPLVVVAILFTISPVFRPRTAQRDKIFEAVAGE